MDIPTIAGIVVQDAEGTRIVGKYYDLNRFPATNNQFDFEKKLFARAKASSRFGKVGESDMFLLDTYTVSVIFSDELIFYVFGDENENELFISMMMNTLFESLDLLLKGKIDKRSVMTHLELLLLTIDEMTENGIPLETDPASIESRVMLRGAVDGSVSSYNELTLNDLADKARDSLAKQFVK